MAVGINASFNVTFTLNITYTHRHKNPPGYSITRREYYHTGVLEIGLINKHMMNCGTPAPQQAFI